MRNLLLICLILVFQFASAIPVNADGTIEGSFTTSDYVPPSPVSNLSAVAITPFSVRLQWTAPGDDGAVGTASTYDIRWFTSPISSESIWLQSNEVTKGVPLPLPAGSNQTFIVTGLLPYTTYYFAMKTRDNNSNWSLLSNCAAATTPKETVATTQTPTPTQPAVGTTATPDDGPICLDIKGKRGVIFLQLLSNGTLARTYIITLNDRQLEMTIQKGTVLLDSSGTPVSVIILEYVEPSMAAPSGFDFQATYNFQPACVIESSVNIKILYDLQKLQADAKESDIKIASYNQNENRWITLPTTKDLAAKAASAKITYFGPFSLLVPFSQDITGSSNVTKMPQLNINNLTLSSNTIEPGDVLTVNFKATNVGDTDGEFKLPLMFDGKTLDTKTVLLKAQQEKTETFTVILEDEGLHTIGVGSTLTTVTVKTAAAAPAGGAPPVRTILLWVSIIGMGVVCIVVIINLLRKGRTFPRRL